MTIVFLKVKKKEQTHQVTVHSPLILCGTSVRLIHVKVGPSIEYIIKTSKNSQLTSFLVKVAITSNINLDCDIWR